MVELLIISGAIIFIYVIGFFMGRWYERPKKGKNGIRNNRGR